MKFLNVLFVLVVLVALVVMTTASLPELEGEEEEVSSQNGTTLGRILAQKRFKRKRYSCKKYPMICHVKGSPGPHCCKKKCVNVLMDRQNCGLCGKKCKYGEICCNGKCVNPSFNPRHCGGCNNGCENGSLCAFGLCNYA